MRGHTISECRIKKKADEYKKEREADSRANFVRTDEPLAEDRNISDAIILWWTVNEPISVYDDRAYLADRKPITWTPQLDAVKAWVNILLGVTLGKRISGSSMGTYWWLCHLLPITNRKYSLYAVQLGDDNYIYLLPITNKKYVSNAVQVMMTMYLLPITRKCISNAVQVR